jgi:hypothetical protein
VAVNHPAEGVYTYTWGGIASTGSYLANWNGQAVSGTPVQASEIFLLISAAQGTGGTVPCGWEVDAGCCDDFTTLYSPGVQAAAKDYGALVVWAATGRRFGLCTKVVRPCGRSTPWTDNLSGYYWAEGTWYPYIFNGAWRNCWAGCACCSCRPECQVWLPGPVNSIVSVTVDDVVIDPTTYRVDDGEWLVRTHDSDTNDCWPTCQDFNLNSGTGVF